MIMSSSIFGPISTTSVKDSGESGFHYYKIVSDRDIFVEQYQQYEVENRQYLDIEGSIEISQDAEVLIGE